MWIIKNWLVANVAKYFLATSAFNFIVSIWLDIYPLTIVPGTLRSKLQIYPRYIFIGMFWNHLLIYFDWQYAALIWVMIWILLVMFLSFCNSVAVPAEVCVALCTLNLGAAWFNHNNRYPTFGIRTAFRAILEVKLVQNLLWVCILFQNELNFVIIFVIHQINSI